MIDLSPASQKLLRELARRDGGAGVAVRYAGRGRWRLDGSSTAFNRGTFPSLFEADLAVGWDEYDDDGPMRVTEAGRKLAAELEAQHQTQQAARKPRSKPSAEGATALRLLREIAKHDGSLVYDDGLRRVWRVASRDGHRASIGIWVALEQAGYIRTDRVSSIGGNRATVTALGRQRLAA
ncbi:hypothetical protein ACFXAS_05470 [Streptomyces sp. NPDC059459]|uniref:hypothetical protein n=1 Tax=Streptomyces sp. NPDC059459 TaxID=3346839 RepID=UPI0036CB202B